MSSLDFNLALSQDESVSAAASALERIRSKRTQQKVLTENVDSASNAKRKRDLIEEFSETVMDTKLKSDAFFYETLLKKVENTDEVSAAISEMVESQIHFYKVLNVSPVLNHFSEHEVLNNSASTNISKGSTIIESFLRTNLFALSTAKREEKYKDLVVPLAESFVDEYSVDTEVAVDLAYKTTVIENLIKHLHSSVYVNLYYEDCLSSDYYKDFFDLDMLKESYTKYCTDVHNTAQIIALTI